MNDRMRIRVTLLRVVVLSLLVTLGARLWVLQILDGDHYRQVAETNRVREVVTPATRGMILDDHGQPLVRNRTSLVISVNRSTTDRQADHGKAVLTRLASVIGTPASELEQRVRFCTATVRPPCWNGSPYQPVPVAKDVSPQQALAVIEHPDRFPGVSADLQAVREYPHGSLAAHELGYLAPVTQDQLDKQGDEKGYHLNSLIGVAGLESTYDDELRGVDGVQRLEVDRFGRVAGTASTAAPVSGDHLVLNLDLGVQEAAEQALQDTINKLGGGSRTASAVVLNARGGGVVAMASLPSYDPSVFVGGVSEEDYQALSDPANGIPLLSRAYQGSGAAGSTFKPVSTAVAMQNLGATGDQDFSCSPTLQIGDQIFHNFDGESAGPITLHQALVISCDVIFDQFAYDAWLADGGLRNGRGPYTQPKEYFVRMAEAMGFGKATGIDLPGESKGSVVDRADAKAVWEELKDSYCRRAKNGYPEEKDPATAERYRKYAAEACVDGYLYNAGAATQFAIGQGQYLSVSPLQLASAYAAIADGGTLYKPMLAKAAISPEGKIVRTYQPSKAGILPVDPKILAYIRDSLKGVTTEPGGTASGVFADWPSAQIPIAGKTGTAEVEGKGDTSWFASFAPADNPQYVVVVTIPESGQGAQYAAPVAKRIYQAIYGVGQQAAQPGGKPPASLPKINRDGTIAAATISDPFTAVGAASGATPTPAANTATPPNPAGALLPALTATPTKAPDPPTPATSTPVSHAPAIGDLPVRGAASGGVDGGSTTGRAPPGSGAPSGAAAGMTPASAPSRAPP
ncbi:penicillin-binding protein 2 [Frankia sp. AiPs1]|uniref:penicillin-binding protein 2 n=1 Tax=Frankia sp. AiPa1 TaxID=573492 RepID=UPI00202B2E9D|nr:penicillin-binding protein 2 [Frankia sp. AiPa1]MCL9761802.1 penicillin-binding protein 2 [Frankia sp. AiPa1]